MALGRELDEAAGPDGLVAERLGVEAGGQLARRRRAGRRPPWGRSRPRRGRRRESTVPRSVWFQRPSAQVVLVLVAPVAVRAAVEAGERGQQRRDARLLAEVLGLLGVEVVEPVAVDGLLPVRPVARDGAGRGRRGTSAGAWACAEQGVGGRRRRAGPGRSGTGPGPGARPGVIAAARPSGISVPTSRTSSIVGLGEP